MALTKKRLQRAWNFHPATFGFRAACAELRHAVGGGPKPLRMLLVSDGAAHTSEQQFAPIARHAAHLGKQLGIVSVHRTVASALALDAKSLSKFDLVGLKLVFHTPAEVAEQVVRHFTEAVSGTPTKVVYFDGDDDLNIQWLPVVARVDLYVKKHVFDEEQAYQHRYIGKSNLTDYVSRVHGNSFADNIIPSSGGLDRSQIGKLHLGWNIALDDKIFDLSRQMDSMPVGPKDIDISCRAYVPPSNWTHSLRSLALERMESMAERYRVLAPRDRVSQDKYYEEMLRSKICVSPFGFGEICWRDFEAILCGCLLVKPDMGHVRTLPRLFVPGVTYIPVRWDYADLDTQCARYLDNEPERLKVVTHARQALLAALEPGWFVDNFADLLRRLDLCPTKYEARSTGI